MLKMDDDSATAVYHAFNMLCYFSPLFGAMLADSLLGKYKWVILLNYKMSNHKNNTFLRWQVVTHASDAKIICAHVIVSELNLM